jgi:hypothetical protein
MHRFHADWFNLNKSSEAEGKEQNWAEISNWLTAERNYAAQVDNNIV